MNVHLFFMFKNNFRDKLKGYFKIRNKDVLLNYAVVGQKQKV